LDRHRLEIRAVRPKWDHAGFLKPVRKVIGGSVQAGRKRLSTFELV
jgi:hypothetical protein